jgi:hypothetical protein
MGGIDVNYLLARVCDAANLQKAQEHVCKVSFSFERSPVFLPKGPKNDPFFVSVLNCLELRGFLVIAVEAIASILKTAFF